MKQALVRVTPLMLLTLMACRPDTVDLSYRFPVGKETHYRMEASADARWNLEGQGRGSYHAVFEVTERVTEDTGGEAVLSVVMEPIDVEEDGLPSPGLETRTFSLRAGPNGEVLEVLEVDGVSAGVLDNDQLGLIATYRPPLPLEPVPLNGAWNAEQQLELPSVFQQVATIGQVTRLDRDAGGRLAQLKYLGRGPLVSSIALPQGEADLTGSTTIHIDAQLDIDEGSLREARSSTAGRFDVRVIPPDQRAPIVGSMHLDLDVRLIEIETKS